MNDDLKKKLQRAKELVLTSRHVSFATVNEDGSPHNSPMRFIYDPKLEYLYWGSHAENLHSKNILRTGQICAVLFDRIERGGLYMRCENGEMLSGKDLENAIRIHNDLRIKEGSKPLELSYYTGGSPQKMWRARITKFWVNSAERSPDGLLIKDVRQEVTAKDILGIS